MAITVSIDNFEREVIEKSHGSLVLADFWAAWCGPCRILAPVLEKLAGEYGFVLVKINTDEEQELARRHNISGIPDVRIYKDGKEVDGFVGALPESGIREILAKHIHSDADHLLDKIELLIRAGKIDIAMQGYDKLLTDYPANKKVAIAAAEFYLLAQEPEKAEKALSGINSNDAGYYEKAQAIKAMTGFIQECREPDRTTETGELFGQASCHVTAGKYEEALDIFLGIIKTDRKYKDDGARKAMVTIFNMLGATHPVTVKYRNKLAMALH